MSNWYDDMLESNFDLLTKEELYQMCENAVGEVLVIPPIEYCIFQCGQHWQMLGFNMGNVFVKFLRSAKRCTVTFEDEFAHPQFLSISDVKEVFS